MATAPRAEVEYPSSDGKPMAESDLHRRIMMDLIRRLEARYAGVPDVYVSGNLLVYYVEGQPQFCLAPDCFVALGVPTGDRTVYKTWEERRPPAVVFEITSKTTQNEDQQEKFRTYQDIWKVRELFLFDPTEDYLDPSLAGFRLVRGVLRPLPMTNGRLTSSVLDITLERDGQRLALRDALNGKPLLTDDEREAERQKRAAARARREVMSQQAELDRLRAEIEALRRGQPPA